jgi:hypothetical protein
VQVDEYEQPNKNAAPIPNATTNPNATKINGDMDKNKAGLHMYPLLETIYGDIFDPTNYGSKKSIKPLSSRSFCLVVVISPSLPSLSF